MIGRLERVSKLLNREISVILQEEINDPRVRGVSVTRVEPTKDLKLAKVFYVTLSDDSDPDVAKGLESVSKFIRAELAKRISMKYVPEISFREDLTEKRMQEVDRLFEVVEKEHEADNGEEGEEAQNG